MRARLLAALLAALTGLSVALPIRAAPAPLVVRWVDGRTVELAWKQTDDANEACIEKVTAAGYFLLDCIRAAPGAQQLQVPAAPTDAAYLPHAGDRYRVTTWKRAADGAAARAVYGPVELGRYEFRLYWPLVAR